MQKKFGDQTRGCLRFTRLTKLKQRRCWLYLLKAMFINIITTLTLKHQNNKYY